MVCAWGNARPVCGGRCKNLECDGNIAGRRRRLSMIRTICPSGSLPKLNASNVASDLVPRANAMVSDQYDFAMLRPAGKVAGTEILNGYLSPAMCDSVYPHDTRKHHHSWRESWEVLFGGHGTGKDSASIVIPKGCTAYLHEHGYLRENRPLAEWASKRLVWVAVRDPFARAVSIYKYVCEERSAHAGLISFERMLTGYGGPPLQMNHLWGNKVGSTHWGAQMPAILAACRFADVRAIRVEPDVIEGLDTIVHEINAALDGTYSYPPPAPPPRAPPPALPPRTPMRARAHGRHERHAVPADATTSSGAEVAVNDSVNDSVNDTLTAANGPARDARTPLGAPVAHAVAVPRLPIPSMYTHSSTGAHPPRNQTYHAGATNANAVPYECPWQCYYQVCGMSCLLGVIESYAEDVFYLGYALPATIDELWQGERAPTGEKALAIANAPNRTETCLSECVLLGPGAKRAPPVPGGGTGVRSGFDIRDK